MRESPTVEALVGVAQVLISLELGALAQRRGATVRFQGRKGLKRRVSTLSNPKIFDFVNRQFFPRVQRRRRFTSLRVSHHPVSSTPAAVIHVA